MMLAATASVRTAIVAIAAHRTTGGEIAGNSFSRLPRRRSQPSAAATAIHAR